MTSELLNAYFATTKPEDQIMTKTHGAKLSSLRDPLGKGVVLQDLHRVGKNFLVL